jgi:hypothetical protein
MLNMKLWRWYIFLIFRQFCDDCRLPFSLHLCSSPLLGWSYKPADSHAAVRKIIYACSIQFYSWDSQNRTISPQVEVSSQRHSSCDFKSDLLDQPLIFLRGKPSVSSKRGSQDTSIDTKKSSQSLGFFFFVRVHVIDYRCENCHIFRCSRVALLRISNSALLSSSGTGVNPGIRSWKCAYLNELWCQKAIGGIFSQRSK